MQIDLTLQKYSVNSMWKIVKIIFIFQDSLKAAQDKLQNSKYDVNTIIAQEPLERHFSCAFLAWQQLGHSSVDSLYEYSQIGLFL